MTLGSPHKAYNAMDVLVMLDNCRSKLRRTNPCASQTRCLPQTSPAIDIGRWPKWIISNVNLYVHCGTGPLSQQVRKIRRSMFGHMLRMPVDTTVQLAMLFTVAGKTDTGAELAGASSINSACCAQPAKRMLLGCGRADTLKC